MMTLWLSLAWAQQRTPFVAGSGWELLPVAETRWLEAAFTTTGQAWGSAAYLEGDLFPLLAESEPGDGVFVMGITSAYVYDALRLPANCVVADVPSDPYCIVHVDAFASTGGLVVGTRNLALFYSASLNGLYAADVGFLRGVAPAVFAPYGAVQMYTAPFSTGPLKIGPGMQDVFGMANSEYIVGLRGELAGVSGHVGFLGSDLGSGLYTNITEERVRLLATAVVRDRLSRAPLLQSGLVKSTLPALLGASEAIKPSLFVRKLGFDDPFVAAEEAAPAAPAADDDPPGFALWTGHGGTTTPILDVEVAAAWSPKPQLHALDIILHTPNYDPTVEPGDFWEDDPAFALHAGVTGMPSMPWYGIEARSTPYVEAEVRVQAFSFKLGYNDRQILALYPYSRNTVFLGIDFLGGT